jgi:lipoprotein-anchoring transpeptidase ErfK/SrfK
MRIEIDVRSQRLRLFGADGRIAFEAPVSTARKGVGEKDGSEQTPRGRHMIRAKIGAGLPENAVLRGRRPTGEIYSPALRAQHPDRDWILTRILWLSGLERGRNRGGDVDTMRRYIYIHGCPDDERIGAPASHGCIRMRNRDVVRLFDLVPTGTQVDIIET